MKIYLATWLFDKTLGRSLTKQKASKRLLSYFFIKQGATSSEQFRKYIRTGRLDPAKDKKK
jgi:hypothetical protein